MPDSMDKVHVYKQCLNYRHFNGLKIGFKYNMYVENMTEILQTRKVSLGGEKFCLSYICWM